MKTGLIMEGGAMRGMFTAGVTDVMMENGITFDGAIGVSAGAVFGCNLKSHQPGRVIRYNTKYCRDPEYAGFRLLLRTGNIFGTDLCYRRIPDELDPFDAETFRKDPMEFYVVATSVATGKAVYHRCDNGDKHDILWMRASASMPLAAEIVEVDGYSLLDGGIADSVPVKYFESIGYNHNVVILTQPENYMKKKNRLLPAMKVAFRDHPGVLRAMENRHVIYNETIKYIREKEKSGELFVIRPAGSLEVARVEHDPKKLRAVYEKGRAVMNRQLEDLQEFLKKTGENKK